MRARRQQRSHVRGGSPAPARSCRVPARAGDPADSGPQSPATIPRRVSRTPRAAAMVGMTRAGSVSGGEIDKANTVGIPIPRHGGNCLGQLSLARAAGTGEGHEPDIFLRQEAESAATSSSRPIRRVGGSGRSVREDEPLGTGDARTSPSGRAAVRRIGALVLPEPEGLGEHAHRLQPWRAVHAPLQIAERPHTHPRALGQLLLGEGRRRAVPPQQIAEAGKNRVPPCQPGSDADSSDAAVKGLAAHRSTRSAVRFVAFCR